ncbi:hypothetical protein BJF83_18450 [Nocardiopsis sp. CNR-923]|nr:hypothetical protein BJF83_18450 [Nocardiopsis sp. CNR-923]
MQARTVAQPVGCLPGQAPDQAGQGPVTVGEDAVRPDTLAPARVDGRVAGAQDHVGVRQGVGEDLAGEEVGHQRRGQAEPAVGGDHAGGVEVQGAACGQPEPVVAAPADGGAVGAQDERQGGDLVEEPGLDAGVPVAGVVGAEGAFGQSAQGGVQAVAAAGAEGVSAVPECHAVAGAQVADGRRAAEVPEFGALELDGHAQPYFRYSSDSGDSLT